MAEKIRKKVYKPVAGAELRPETMAAPEIREEPAAVVQASAEPASASEAAAAPYAEFGGLSETLAARRAQASRSREEALSSWQKALEEQKSARLALVNAAKPEDTTREQRKLRNLAIGQAVGEFVGALFGGIHGLGSRAGRGYVPKMPGMYRNTLERLQQLRNHDIIANQRFRNLMGSMLERNAGDRAAAAKARYDAAVKDGQTADVMQDKVALARMQAIERAALAARQAGDRKELARLQAQWRMALAQYNASARESARKAKDNASKGNPVIIDMLRNPETKHTQRTGIDPYTGRKTITHTYEPEYTKERRARDVQDSNGYDAMRLKFGLQYPEIRDIIDALNETDSRDKVSLEDIWEALEQKKSPEWIASRIYRVFGAKGPKSGSSAAPGGATQRYIYRDQN